jgi:hypothetical protein
VAYPDYAGGAYPSGNNYPNNYPAAGPNYGANYPGGGKYVVAGNTGHYEGGVWVPGNVAGVAYAKATPCGGA